MKKIFIFIKRTIYFFLSNFHFRGAVVLMYHSVGKYDAFFNVSRDRFYEQMQYIVRKKYKVIAIKDLVHTLRNKKQVVITFDDGYENNYTEVFPIIKKYNIPITIFLTTGKIGDKNNEHREESMPMLDWSQIEEMHISGLVDFEPHTYAHPKLSKISFDQAKKEILESKEMIEKKLNKKCNFFAYPYGDYDKRISNFVSENFELAFTVNKGRILKIGDKSVLQRNSIDKDVSTVDFRGIINFGRI